MEITRRELLGSAAALPAAAVRLDVQAAATGTPRLPAKADFPHVIAAETCLNNARWHPLSLGAMRAIQEYLEYKSRGGGGPGDIITEKQNEAKVLFAQLINAKPSEISYVQSTTVGENLVVSGLGLPGSRGNVVTDALHFEGSLYLYGALQKLGLDVRILRPRNWRIELSDLEKAVDRKTKLIALSLVSFINGFQHDLKAVCDLAHAQGALVYADVIQAVGAIPFDVRASGVDFCACASYKWLMGDMGLGFMYVREDLLEKVIRRSQYGYRQLSDFEYHIFPYDSPGSAVADWKQAHGAAAHFEIGTLSNTTVVALTHSLRYIQQLGVQNIQNHVQSLLRLVKKEVPSLGFDLMTPPESTSPIVTFAVKDPAQTARRLKRANVDVALSNNRMRISPSVYNDESDVKKLLDALA